MTDHGSGHGLPGDRANVGMPAHGAHDGHAMAHDKHAGHSVAMFRDKFWLSLALTIPVLLWSRDPQAWLGYAAPQFRGSDWIPASSGPRSSCTAASSSCAGPPASCGAGSPG
jgi:Cu2+-exporting ATPase